MIEYEEVLRPSQEIISVKCDKCGKKYRYGNIQDEMEIQEFLFIREVGGYGSVFGDCAEINFDICQRCLKEFIDGDN